MNETFEQLNTLDVLLLVFVKHGLATTYEFRSQAGLGGSLTVTQLQTLEKKGLLTSRTGEQRMAKRYSITDAGEKQLVDALGSYVQRQFFRGRIGLESMARALFFEWLYPEHVNGAETARATLASLEIQRKEKELEADRCNDALDRIKRESPDGDYGLLSGNLVANTFRLIRAKAEVALLRAQSEVLDRFVGVTNSLPPAPRLGNKNQIAGAKND